MRFNLLTLILLLFFTINTYAQSYKFKVYSSEEGLSQPFVYDIIQDKRGYLWVATGEGLSRFDGRDFTVFTDAHGLSENFISKLFNDKRNKLWIGHNQGSLTVFDNNEFREIETFDALEGKITDIKADDQQQIWVLSQNGKMIRISRDEKVMAFSEGLENYLLYSLGITSEGRLLIGTNNGLFTATVEGDEISNLERIPEIADVTVNNIIKRKNVNSFWIATEDEGVFRLSITRGDNFSISKVAEDYKLEDHNIQEVFEDSKGNIWLSTMGSGIIKLNRSQSTGAFIDQITYNTDNGLPNNFVRSIYQDTENNIWIGSYGNGLLNFTDDFFLFYNNEDMNVGNNVTSLYFTSEVKYFGITNALVAIHVTRDTPFTLMKQEYGVPEDDVTAVVQDADSNIWIGTSQSGLFVMNKGEDTFEKFTLSKSFLSNSISTILLRHNKLWVATRDGIYIVNRFDNEDITHLNTDNGLLHNNVNHIYLDSNDDVWIATSSNYITKYTNREMFNYKVSGSNEVLNLTSVTEDRAGNIWIATNGNGVFRNTTSATFYNYTINDGLKSNYCYSIITDYNNNIWIGHRGGISRLNFKNENIDVFDSERGINVDFNPNAVFKDERGRLWFGTDNGTIQYDPSKETVNEIPPAININAIHVSDDEMLGISELELPHDAYKIRFDFLGISFKNPEKVTYQYKLEGFDLEWSEPTTNTTAVYPRLEDGKYTFKVKSCNSDGFCNEEPATFNLVIDSPFWKKPLFIIGAILVLGYIVILTIKIRERNHKRIQKYLKQTLAERTKEVVKQKEEIEKKNQDITDSINYAKRIQEAILPEDKRLKRFFPDSFILYKPRDIVSGDFYWFDRFHSKFLIACSDCTGHGVPGAFMSMIGSMLLKDISSVKSINSPDVILNTLDKEINSVLKQRSSELTNVQDGMDISICEIDLETRKMRFSSAMRPVLIFKGSEFIEVKGDRNSIGGTLMTDTKEFTLQEEQLEEGDVVYMFSDGYADQFGGENGKKMKTSRLWKLLEEIYDLPMQEQKVKLDDYFNEWKDNHPQVDDVIFIGIRV